MCQQEHLVAQHNAAISVLIMQASLKCKCILWASITASLVSVLCASPCTGMQQLFFSETRSGEILNVLICQPVPSGFLSGVIVGTKVHPVNLSIQSRESFLQVLHDQATHSLLLYPHVGISWGFLFPIGCQWHHYYITSLPAKALPISDEPSNQKPFPPWHTLTHAL